MRNGETRIYHLAERRRWEKALALGERYFPPSYTEDGFIHGTSDPAKLLIVASHFYRDSVDEWCCLCMTLASLKNSGVEVRFEPAAPVGAVSSDFEGSDTDLFPHIYGGVHAEAVLEQRPVLRGTDGTFLSVEGVTD